MSTTGATLAFRRRAMGVSKKAAAARLGVSKDTLADWEAGRVDVPDEGVTVYAYRTPEAHAAANGDGETLYEHSAVVASIVTGLALRGVHAEVEWRRGNG